MKLLQLNIFQGKYLDRVIDFVRENDIDILHFQEVTGGEMSKGGVNVYPNKINYKISKPSSENIGVDIFGKVKKELSYDGINGITFGLVSSPESYESTATFVKNNIEIISHDQIWMEPFREVSEIHGDPAGLPRSALILKLRINGQTITTVNTHLAWGPTAEDKPYKLTQGKILFDYVDKIDGPFILTGDFNLTPNSDIPGWFSKISRNLTVEHKITNTLNPNVHSVEKLFPPGLAVDYIFTSPQIKVTNFRLADEVDLSDHYGLLLEFEI